MSNQYIVKVCINSNNNVQKELEILLSLARNVDRIYYNFYKPEYRSGQRYEEPTWMENYTKQAAVKFLKKRLRGNSPFFLDIYGTKKFQEQEAFTLVRLGEYMLLYIILCKDNFVIQKKLLFSIIEDLIAKNILLMGYCSDLADFWWNVKSDPENFAWDQRRRWLYSAYNTTDYSLEDEKALLLSDEIWYPACWMIWCNRNFLCESKYDLLKKHKHFFYVQRKVSNGIILQLYKYADEYNNMKNRLASQKFYEYLKNNKIFTCGFWKS